MAFAQLTYRESLRDIEACLGAAPKSSTTWAFGRRCLAALWPTRTRRTTGASTGEDTISGILYGRDSELAVPTHEKARGASLERSCCVVDRETFAPGSWGGKTWLQFRISM
jgi:hypothetical protein